MVIRNARCTTPSIALALVALAAIEACSAAGGPSDNGLSFEFSGKDKATHPIIGGTKATAYPAAALVDLYKDGKPAGGCSGLVIAPQVVLTSGRCVEGFNGWRVITPFASAQTRVTKSAATQYAGEGKVINADSHDIGLLFVSEPFQLQAYPLLAKQLVAEGTMVINVGRGLDGKVSDHDLSQGKAVPVTLASEFGFPHHFETEQAIESDDFGGPALLTGGLPHTVVAVNSAIGYGTQLLARVDQVAAWIEQQIDAHGGPGPSGGGGSGGSDPGGTGGSGGEPGGAGGSGAGGIGGAPGTGGTAGDPGTAGTGGTPEPGTGGAAGTGGQPDNGGVPGCDGNPEFEPNDSSQPQSLFPAMCGKLDTPDDEDWYVFGVAGPGVGYRVASLGGDTEVLMWKQVDGYFYPIANESPSVVANTSNGPGTYFVAVWSPSASVTQYRLTLEVNNP